MLDNETDDELFGPRFRVGDDGVVQDDEARTDGPPPTPPPHQSNSEAPSAPAAPKALRVGTTFITPNGSQAEIVKVTHSYVWLHMTENGKSEGPFKFPRRDVEDALANEIAERNASTGRSRPVNSDSARAGYVPPQPAAQSSGPKRGIAALGITPAMGIGIAVAGLIGIALIGLVNATGSKNDRSSSSSGTTSSSKTSTTRPMTVNEQNYVGELRYRTRASGHPWPDNSTLIEQGWILCTDMRNNPELTPGGAVMAYDSWHPDSPALPNDSELAEFQVMEALIFLCNGLR